MKKVRVVILPVNDGDIVKGRIVRENNSGGKWKIEETYEVTSGTPGADREMLLEDEDRLVIEGEHTHKLVVDSVQNVASYVEIEPKLVEAHAEGASAPKPKAAVVAHPKER